MDGKQASGGIVLAGIVEVFVGLRLVNLTPWYRPV
jgi:predicted RND superfamily exporter protein